MNKSTNVPTLLKINSKIKELQEQADLIQAHDEGQPIQYLSAQGKWNYITTPSWAFDIYKYRIKPKVTINAEELTKAILKFIEQHQGN